MTELQKIINQRDILKKDLDGIKKSYGYNEGFDNNSDLQLFKEENINALNQLKVLQESIEKLEWELKNPEEQTEILEQRRLSKLKREGKLD